MNPYTYNKEIIEQLAPKIKAGYTIFSITDEECEELHKYRRYWIWECHSGNCEFLPTEPIDINSIAWH